MASSQASPAVSNTTPRKKYVTSACKRRKSKCDGCEPCSRCLHSDIGCTYNSSYNRIQRNRLVSPGSGAARDLRRSLPLPQLLNRQKLRSGTCATKSARPISAKAPQPLVQHESESSDSRAEDDSGDASVHAFLRRVSDQLAQVGQGLPRNLFKRDQDSLDGANSNACSFLLPDRGAARAYVDCFFEHALVTYRYMPRKEVYTLLEQIYAEDEATLQDHVTMAMMLLVLGIGCLWTASWKNEPLPPWRKKAYKFLQAAETRLEKTHGAFPPTPRLIRAQVLKCQLELGSSRFNSAWMTLGLAVRLSQMIDIQRDPAFSNPVEAHYQRNLFWAMFAIDRYLAVSLGRPMAIHESDITVSLSPDLDPAVANFIGPHEKKLLTGVVAHARLTKILGHIMTRLYPGARRTSSTPIDQAVAELEDEMNQWLRDTPKFFHPRQETHTDASASDPAAAAAAADQDFYDVPWVFRRQQRTVRAAFFFANMLIYRGYLLREFLGQAPSTPRSSPSSPRVKACVDNALAMVVLAVDFGVEECKYNAAFWTTSHFLFCAISILLVYLTLYQEASERATIESAIAKAMKVHRKLDYSANINAQKLLEESRTGAQTVRNMAPTVAPVATDQQILPHEHSDDRQLEDGDDGQEQEQLGSTEAAPPYTSQHDDMLSFGGLPDGRSLGEGLDGMSMGPFGTTGDFNMIMDIGFDNTSFSFPGSFDGENEFPFECGN